jgi:O-antigen/teichoic acid export membrane protein
MLGYLTNTREVGIYAAGFTLASLIYMIARSMTTVLLPTVSEVKQRDALSIYIRESFRYTIPLFLLLLPFLWSAKFLIFRLYGASYSGSVNVFRVLAFGRLLAILTAPVGIVAYAINRPQVFTVANASQLAANCLGNYFLIPKYGALGAAIVTSGTRIVASIGIVIYIVSCLRTNSSVFFTNSTKRIEE